MPGRSGLPPGALRVMGVGLCRLNNITSVYVYMVHVIICVRTCTRSRCSRVYYVMYEEVLTLLLSVITRTRM